MTHWEERGSDLHRLIPWVSAQAKTRIWRLGLPGLYLGHWKECFSQQGLDIHREGIEADANEPWPQDGRNKTESGAPSPLSTPFLQLENVSEWRHPHSGQEETKVTGRNGELGVPGSTVMFFPPATADPGRTTACPHVRRCPWDFPSRLLRWRKMALA